jgi:hypothetical protein
VRSSKQIVLSGDAAVQVLMSIEYMLISLKNIARHFYDNVEHSENIDPIAYALETTRFIDQNAIIYKLAKMRSLISEPFDKELDAEELEEIEEAMESIKFWQNPGD